MEIKRFCLVFALAAGILPTVAGWAQMPSYNGFPPPAPSPAPATPATPSQQQAEQQPRQEQPRQQPQEENPGAVGKFDPFMDNHLRAPDASEKLGLFGLPIKEVERILRQYGAKNYSYAFGKYSRMSLSVYLVTMYFDRDRCLGGVAVEPRPPYQQLAPDARKFFFDLFLENSDLSRFKAIITAGRLELRFIP